jgi:ribosome-associated translation inhibitor RaiA
MNISLNATQFPELPSEGHAAIERKLAPIGRLLGTGEATALLDVEIAHAPAEGRSATPTRLTATLTFGGEVVHAEAVKPTPESAADRVRSTLEAEVRRVRGKGKSVWKRGAERLKDMVRFES